MEAVKASHSDMVAQRDEKKKEERQLGAKLEELKNRLAVVRGRQQDEAKELDRLMQKSALLKQKQEELTDSIRKLGGAALAPLAPLALANATLRALRRSPASASQAQRLARPARRARSPRAP